MKAVFWILSGSAYLAEGVNSAESIRAVHPDLECCLFTPDEFTHPAFTRVVRLPPRVERFWYLDLMNYVCLSLRQLPELLLYLDSDTYVIEPVPELFELLERFDFAAAHAPGRLGLKTATVEKVPRSFPEFNIGVITMRNNERVRNLWDATLEAYRAHADVYKNNDQSPLREALWKQPDISIATLTPEYNCRFNFGTFASGPVKILHGRGLDHEAVAASVNRTVGRRLWEPGQMKGTA